MKTLSLFALPGVLAGCDVSPDTHQTSLAKRIDTAVVLPRKASPLSDYAGYFAVRPDGKVAVFYTAYVDHGTRPDGTDCVKRSPPCGLKTAPKAGDRLWVDFKSLPEASDGGCSILNAVFDPATNKMDVIECNGPS